MVEAGYEFHKENILDGNDVKVFFHTWETEDQLHEKALDLYQPSNWLVEKSLDVDLSKYTNTPPPSPNWKVKDGRMSTYAQLYEIERCNSMKFIYEQGFEMTFDWVIRSRFDFAINARIPFDELDNNKLHIPNCRMANARFPRGLQPADGRAISGCRRGTRAGARCGAPTAPSRDRPPPR
jgi:hypothetical protein